MAQGHQESARGRDEDHAPGSNTAGVRPECHRDLPSAAEAVQRPRFILRAEGVETLECIRSRSERRGARALQPDVIIGWSDWNKVQPFVMSRWAILGQALPGATAPATKWHLRMNHKGGPPTYLNVELDPMRKRSTITHEAAVRIGMLYEAFYMLFARAEDGEVRNLVAVGADTIV
jgi:hypothetical protein